MQERQKQPSKYCEYTSQSNYSNQELLNLLGFPASIVFGKLKSEGGFHTSIIKLYHSMSLSCSILSKYNLISFWFTDCLLHMGMPLVG